jgi:hypothetical protein
MLTYADFDTTKHRDVAGIPHTKHRDVRQQSIAMWREEILGVHQVQYIQLKFRRDAFFHTAHS